MHPCIYKLCYRDSLKSRQLQVWVNGNKSSTLHRSQCPKMCVDYCNVVSFMFSFKRDILYFYSNKKFKKINDLLISILKYHVFSISYVIVILNQFTKVLLSCSKDDLIESEMTTRQQSKAVGFEHLQQSISKMVDKCSQSIALCNFAGQFAIKTDSNIAFPYRQCTVGTIVRFPESSQTKELEVSEVSIVSEMESCRQHS